MEEHAVDHDVVWSRHARYVSALFSLAFASLTLYTSGDTERHISRIRGRSGTIIGDLTDWRCRFYSVVPSPQLVVHSLGPLANELVDALGLDSETVELLYESRLSCQSRAEFRNLVAPDVVEVEADMWYDHIRIPPSRRERTRSCQWIRLLIEQLRVNSSS